MNSVWGDVKPGVAAFIEEQRNIDRDARFTFVAFDTEFDTVCRAEDVHRVNTNRIFDRVYPRSLTALLDAIGQTIDDTDRRLDQIPRRDLPENVIFVVYTDGYENASRRYTRNQIRHMIEQHQERDGWNFIFLGAGIDAFAEGRNLGFDDWAIKGTQHTNVGTRGTYAGAGMMACSIRMGEAEEVSSRAFDSNYMAIVGEAPEQTAESSSSTGTSTPRRRRRRRHTSSSSTFVPKRDSKGRFTS
jgi:hypothetical protein